MYRAIVFLPAPSIPSMAIMSYLFMGRVYHGFPTMGRAASAGRCPRPEKDEVLLDPLPRPRGHLRARLEPVRLQLLALPPVERFGAFDLVIERQGAERPP